MNSSKESQIDHGVQRGLTKANQVSFSNKIYVSIDKLLFLIICLVENSYLSRLVCDLEAPFFLFVAGLPSLRHTTKILVVIGHWVLCGRLAHCCLYILSISGSGRLSYHG